MPNKKVSLGDIARELGISRMAVSLALRNQTGRISEDVRRRVQKTALKLGYETDAHMASWMSQVRASKINELIPLAWLNADPNEDAYHFQLDMVPYFEGARKRCQELGYSLKEFWLRSHGMSERRISQILNTQGIQGVIITPTGQLGSVNLDWKLFSVASFEKALTTPSIHQAVQDYHSNMMLALKILHKIGYKRIGVFLSAWSDDRSYHACQGAVAYFQSLIHRAERIPVLAQRYSMEPGKEFRPWLQRYKPDVVVGQHSQLIEWIESAGYRVPEEVGCFHMAVEDDCIDWSGIWVHKREIGAAAAEMVISQVQNHLFGLPAISRDVLIRGRWHPGRTLLNQDRVSTILNDQETNTFM